MNELSVSNDELIRLLGAKEAELYALRREIARLNLELTAMRARNGYEVVDSISGGEK